MEVKYYDKEEISSGTSLQGYVTAEFVDLYDVFGRPNRTDSSPHEKVNCEWTFRIHTEEDEYIDATVYNWKTGTIPYNKYEWHIGGRSYRATELIQEILDRRLKPANVFKTETYRSSNW